MSPETLAILAKRKPSKSVWCQHGQAPGMKIDEHQVCIDQRAAHFERGYTTWTCTCKCHR
jgi:hypothetical protein